MTKILFTMHDGKKIIAEVENYDANAIKELLNDRTEEYVSFGNVGFQKFTVKYFEPYVEGVTESN